MAIHGRLTVLGGIILFSSWLVEKKFQFKWNEEKEQLKRSQLVIDISESQKTICEFAYISELRKKPADTLLLSFYQQRLSRVYMDMLNWSKVRVSGNTAEYSDLNHSRKLIDSINKASFVNKDYGTINTNFTGVAAAFDKSYLRLDNDFSKKYDQVISTADKWDLVFTILYILGSVLVGLGYVFELLLLSKREATFAEETANPHE
jgi:hypothetical protein